MGRTYRLGKRAEAVERTRRRILEATMAVHDEQGIVAGRWPDIAERAGVSLATIYRHFPTLDDLAAACGRLTMELVDPPSAARAAEVFRGAASQAERLELLVRETFAFYERAGRVVDNVRRDRHHLAVIEEAHAELEDGLGALVTEALRPLATTEAEQALVRALLDVRSWEAMRERGLGAEEAVEAGCRLVLAAVSERAGAG